MFIVHRPASPGSQLVHLSLFLSMRNDFVFFLVFFDELSTMNYELLMVLAVNNTSLSNEVVNSYIVRL